MTTPRRPHLRSLAGFTLLELMASIAIVLVLAGLLTVGVSKWRRSAQSVQCIANLRQVGVTLALYVQDNAGSLPGPLWRGQSPYYETAPDGSFDAASGNLASFLAPYLNLNPAATGVPTLAQALTCPAWQSSKGSAQHTICYYSNGDLTQTGESEEAIRPFGKAGENPIPPLTMVALERPAETPALWEFDRKIAGDGFYATDSRVPAAPVHGNTRHTLYFDGHAEARSVN